MRNDRKSKWTTGTVYAHCYSRDVAERKKTAREALIDYNRNDSVDDEGFDPDDVLASI